jgi:malonate-semialdehyde dehydrogenase (acetylating) / methylmalonate-semialdehyde dehydrogenase
LVEEKVSTMTSVPHFIGGRTRAATGVIPVYNPATGEVATHAPVADDALIDETIHAARHAFEEWRRSSLSSRTNILFTFRQLLVRHAEELAALLTSEHGKTIVDARGELARGLENVEYACGLTEHLKGDFSTQVADGVDVHSVREPVGVVAAITPFNFPAMVPLWMTANALASGNVVVLKPSERDPSVSVRLGELLTEAGLPDGVFNVVHGNADTVNALLAHPGVDAVSFVGSTPVARHVYLEATSHGKRVQALGGAKNHMVVLPDADLDVAADSAINAGFGSAGERCMAISVVVAVGSIADDLVERIAQRIDKLTVGPGDDPASDFGPLITREHRDRVATYVTGAAADGVSVVRDGTDLTTRPGFFLGPCLLDGVRPGTRSYDDEIFGPVLGVARVDTYADAVAMVNANPYGNGVAIFTRDGNTARLFARDVSVGMIGVNVPIPVPISAYSFGGWKSSLFGHSHIYGPEGFAFYTRAKVVTTRWPQASESQIDLGFPTTR